MSSYRLQRMSKMGRLIKAIAETEIDANSAVAVHRQADFTKTDAFRRKHGVSTTALIAKAIATVLARNPQANRRIVPIPLLQRFVTLVQQFNTVDVTVAAERTGAGYENTAFVDIVRSAESADLQDVHRKIRALQGATVENNAQWRAMEKLARLPFFLAYLIVTLPRYIPSMWKKYRGGSVMISSPGKYGIDSITGSWMTPLGFSFGFIKQRPMVVDGELVPRLSCTLTMSFDRRLLAGAPAASIFSEITELIENPERMVAAEETPQCEPVPFRAQVA